MSSPRSSTNQGCVCCFPVPCSPGRSLASNWLQLSHGRSRARLRVLYSRAGLCAQPAWDQAQHAELRTRCPHASQGTGYSYRRCCACGSCNALCCTWSHCSIQNIPSPWAAAGSELGRRSLGLPGPACVSVRAESRQHRKHVGTQWQAGSCSREHPACSTTLHPLSAQDTRGPRAEPCPELHNALPCTAASQAGSKGMLRAAQAITAWPWADPAPTVRGQRGWMPAMPPGTHWPALGICSCMRLELSGPCQAPQCPQPRLVE